MPCQRAWSLSEFSCGLADTAAFSLIFGQLVQSEFTGYVPRPLKRPLWQRERPGHVTDMWGSRSRILDAQGHKYWMPKLRVVALRIFDGIAGFERGVERFCEVGSSGFWAEMNGLCVWVSASGKRFVPLRCRYFGYRLPRVSAQLEASRAVVKPHHVPHMFY